MGLVSMETRIAAVLVSAAIAGCSSPVSTATPSPTPSIPRASPTAPTNATSGLPTAPIAAQAGSKRTWFLIPDGLFGEPAGVFVRFDADPSAALPVIRLRGTGREAPLFSSTGPNFYGGSFDLHDVAPGRYVVDVVEHLAGGESVVANTEIIVSAPEYVVWTLDFEGDAAGDTEMANTAAIADGLGVPMTLMWNPRVWTTTQVTGARADAMLAWTKGRLAKGDEVALHLHMWTDFVRAAGLVPRTAANWGGRSDGYDVPLTAYDEAETRTLVEFSLRLMAEHGLPKPSSFRGGGLFANAANLRAVAALGFTADCSATPAGPFGRLQLPWTLAPDAQPYYPARDDANAAGDLPLLEAPTIAGNTYGQSASSIAAVAQADLRLIAPPGQPQMQKRALTVVSHPGTIDAIERAAIETLFRAFDPYRYDRDAGPLRFVTLAQLAKAYAR